MVSPVAVVSTPRSVGPTTVALQSFRYESSRNRQSVDMTRRRKRYRISDSFVRHFHARAPLQPFRHGKAFLTQELRIEQLRLIARAIVGEDGHDGVARPHVLGQPDRARDIDARRSAHA